MNLPQLMRGIFRVQAVLCFGAKFLANFADVPKFQERDILKIYSGKSDFLRVYVLKID
jgi:hypothetical protein